MFYWNRIGQVFNLEDISTPVWMSEQAQNPFVVDNNGFLRVYFNCRAKKDSDGKSVSHAGFVDLDKNNLFNILNISSEPILQLGDKGSFDEFGVMAGSVYPFGDQYYLYYCGWTRMVSVPYNWDIGLAISKDGGVKFSRYSKGPIIGSSPSEPYLHAGCSCIILEDSIYHLWYTSGIKWIDTGSKPESVYQIMHATSKDGIIWNREGMPIIKPTINDEAQASPTILRINGRWHMFFSYRHSVNFRNKDRGYRIGYAWSEDLRTWTRDDLKLNFDVSETGWDSEMICYPHICRINEKICLFYCGNDFGKLGFGVAELIKID